MLLAVVADLHANLEATEAVFQEIKSRRPDLIVCLGDVTGYNANPNEVVDIVREHGVHCVMGNHDAAVCGLEDPWLFRSAARTAIEWQRARVREEHRRWLAGLPRELVVNGACLAVHASPNGSNEYIRDWLGALPKFEFLSERGLRFCLLGHTHEPLLVCEQGELNRPSGNGCHRLQPDQMYFINPGAVGQPRDEDPRAAFAWFDLDSMTVQFQRVEYDLDMSVRKIVRSGLPAELGIRLLTGGKSTAQDALLRFESFGPVSVATVKPEPGLDPANMFLLVHELVQYVRAHPGVNLLLNFGALDYLPNGMLSELLKVKHLIGIGGGTFRLCADHAEVLNSIRATKLEKALPMEHGLYVPLARFIWSVSDSPPEPEAEEC